MLNQVTVGKMFSESNLYPCNTHHNYFRQNYLRNALQSHSTKNWIYIFYFHTDTYCHRNLKLSTDKLLSTTTVQHIRYLWKNEDLPQLVSSEPSLQSLLSSQTKSTDMHILFWHWNSWSLHCSWTSKMENITLIKARFNAI